MNRKFIYDGHSSFKKELAKLEKNHPEQYNKIYIELKKLEKRATFIQKGKKYPVLKKIDGLYQLRVNDYRILFEIKDSIIYYLQLFEKKSNSTPQRYYETAKKRKIDF